MFLYRLFLRLALAFCFMPDKRGKDHIIEFILVATHAHICLIIEYYGITIPVVVVVVVITLSISVVINSKITGGLHTSNSEKRKEANERGDYKQVA